MCCFSLVSLVTQRSHKLVQVRPRLGQNKSLEVTFFLPFLASRGHPNFPTGGRFAWHMAPVFDSTEVRRTPYQVKTRRYEALWGLVAVGKGVKDCGTPYPWGRPARCRTLASGDAGTAPLVSLMGPGDGSTDLTKGLWKKWRRRRTGTFGRLVGRQVREATGGQTIVTKLCCV